VCHSLYVQCYIWEGTVLDLIYTKKYQVMSVFIVDNICGLLLQFLLWST